MSTWIVVSGMRRSGSALHYAIVKEMVGEESCHGWITWQRFSDLYREIDGKSKLAVVKSHTFLPRHCSLAARALRENRMLVVHSYRDVRDVAASVKTFMPKDYVDTRFEETIIGAMKESDEWMDVKGIHASKYEDVMADLEGEVRKIAEYLGVQVNCAEIAERCSMENNRKRLPSEKVTPDKVWWHNHIGNGEVGKWERELSASEIQMVNRVGSGWLSRMGYT